MTALRYFDKELGTLLRTHERPHPFVCSGNPLECKIFIVGLNAATGMKAEEAGWQLWQTRA